MKQLREKEKDPGHKKGAFDADRFQGKPGHTFGITGELFKKPNGPEILI